MLEALGAGWTRLPDLPDEAYVLEADDTLLVCPWNLRIRVAEAALSARDGVPGVLADAFVPPVLAGLAKAVVDDWRSGARVLEHGVPRVHEQIATWGVPLRWFVLRRPGGARAASSSRAGGCCATAPRSPRPAGGPTGRCRCCAGRWATRRSPRRSRRAPAGWRSSTRGRSSSSTTAAWSTCSRTTTWPRTIRPGWSPPGWPRCPRGDADAATEAYEKLVARWRAVQLAGALQLSGQYQLS